MTPFCKICHIFLMPTMKSLIHNRREATGRAEKIQRTALPSPKEGHLFIEPSSLGSVMQKLVL